MDITLEGQEPVLPGVEAISRRCPSASQCSPVLIGHWSDVGGDIIFPLRPVGPSGSSILAVLGGMPWFLVVLAI